VFFRNRIPVIEVKNIITNTCKNELTEKCKRHDDWAKETSPSKKGKLTIGKGKSFLLSSMRVLPCVSRYSFLYSYCDRGLDYLDTLLFTLIGTGGWSIAILFTLIVTEGLVDRGPGWSGARVTEWLRSLYSDHKINTTDMSLYIINRKMVYNGDPIIKSVEIPFTGFTQLYFYNYLFQCTWIGQVASS